MLVPVPEGIRGRFFDLFYLLSWYFGFSLCQLLISFSRLVCLRIHPTFGLLHPTQSYVSFTAIDGSKHDVWPESGEQLYEGDRRPNGKVSSNRILVFTNLCSL